MFGKAAKRLISISTAFLFLIPAALPGKAITPASPSTIYVSVAGSDKNDGSFASPWQHIQYAIDHAAAGETVEVMGGTYHEKIAFHRSGSALAGYLTLRNYADETAVLDGSSVDGTTMIAIAGQQYIRIAGLELADNLSPNADTDSLGIQVSDGSSYIDIEGCRIHGIDTPDISSGNSNPLLIIGNTNQTMHNITVAGNEIYDCKTGWSEGLTVNGNVDNWSIVGNTVHDITNIGIDAAGHWDTECETPSLNQARNGVISGNLVYNCASPNAWNAGLYVDGGKNILIENNTVHDCLYGIEVGCEQQHDAYDDTYPGTADHISVCDNIVYNNPYCGIAMGGWDKSQSGEVVNSRIVNNTLSNNDTAASGMGELNVAWSDGCLVENNIVYGAGKDFLVLRDPINPVSNFKMDYNVFYLPEGSSATPFQWGNQTETSLSDWRSDSGNDAHSVFAAPRFYNDSLHDFRLQSGSPAVNAGDPATEIADSSVDYAGNTRLQGGRVDCGAYESGFASVPPSVGTAPSVRYSVFAPTLCGWSAPQGDGVIAGAVGKELSTEGVRISLAGNVPACASITYQVYLQSRKWTVPASNGAPAGAPGSGLRMEALRITLSNMPGYAVHYRAHVQHTGWTAWQTTASGVPIEKAAAAGTMGRALRLEAVEIQLVQIP